MKKLKELKFTTKLLAAAAILFAPQAANAMELNITYDEGVSKQQIRAFETAKEIYETLITDNIEVNIHVQEADPAVLRCVVLFGSWDRTTPEERAI